MVVLSITLSQPNIIRTMKEGKAMQTEKISSRITKKPPRHTFHTLMRVSIVLTMMCAQFPQTRVTANESSNNEVTQTSQSMVEIQDIHGPQLVPFQPKRVVALDNRTFETLSDWGIPLVAAPKDVMPADSPYVSDERVINIGNHREPNLEQLAAANPDLVIVGQRFAAYYEEIKALVPQAVVIDFSWDVSGDTLSAGDSLIECFKLSTTNLGLIFDQEQAATELIDQLDQSLAAAKAAYNKKDTLLSVVVSAGEIGFAAPHSGRVWGPLYDIFDWQASLVLDNASSNHTGDDISVEAIAQSNPDWLLVLDRDASLQSNDGATPATDVIENAQALQNTHAVQAKQVVYAPADTYTNESVQTYIELFDRLTAAFSE